MADQELPHQTETEPTEASFPDEMKSHLLTEATGILSEMGTVKEESLTALQSVLEALPEGELKKQLHFLEEIAPQLATMSELTPKVQDFLWNMVKKVIAAEAPFVLLLPEDPHNKIQATLIRISGKVGVEAAKAYSSALELKQHIKEFFTPQQTQALPTAA